MCVLHVYMFTLSDKAAVVDAPFINSRRTASTSPALMAKNNTGIGTRLALGSAPRRSSRRMVEPIISCLVLGAGMEWDAGRG